jgi:hypothetical protein
MPHGFSRCSTASIRAVNALHSGLNQGSTAGNRVEAPLKIQKPVLGLWTFFRHSSKSETSVLWTSTRNSLNKIMGKRQLRLPKCVIAILVVAAVQKAKIIRPRVDSSLTTIGGVSRNAAGTYGQGLLNCTEPPRISLKVAASLFPLSFAGFLRTLSPWLHCTRYFSLLWVSAQQ